MTIMQVIVFASILLYIWMTFRGGIRILEQTFVLDPDLGDVAGAFAVSAAVHAVSFGIIGGIGYAVVRLVS